MTTKLYAILSSLLLAFGLGLGLGWKLWMGKTTTVYREVPAPPIKLSNGGEVLEKRVAKSPSIKQELPQGSTVLEEGSIIFEPTKPIEDDQHVTPPEPLKQYTINFAVVKLSDNSRRISASSPDGTIVGGVDVVIDPPKHTEPLRNSAGLVYGTTAWGDTAKGVYYDRDWKLFRAGAELTRNTYAIASRTGWEARVKFGVNF